MANFILEILDANDKVVKGKDKSIIVKNASYSGKKWNDAKKKLEEIMLENQHVESRRLKEE